jgi:DNA uptake protein ComE-like DNA-binding protein
MSLKLLLCTIDLDIIRQNTHTKEVAMKKLYTLLFATVLSLSFAASGITADQKPVPAAVKTTPAATQKAEPAPAAAKQELLDINTASEAELKDLAGIGDVYAKKIIAGRPYAKKDQLLTKKVVPQATYDKIKDKIIAKQAPKK